MTPETLEKLLLNNPEVSVDGQDVTPQPSSTDEAVCDGLVFDSPGECARYRELKIYQRVGIIRNLKTQHEDVGLKGQDGRKHRWLLYPSYIRNGKKIQPIYYISDFIYEQLCDGEWVEVVEDYKGREREIFKQKWKILCGNYPEKHFFLNFKVKSLFDPDLPEQQLKRKTRAHSRLQR